MPKQHKVWLDSHKENDGRWGTVRGEVKGCVYRVNILVFSHDERWYVQKPALTIPVASKKLRAFHTDVAFGLEGISNLGREYIVVACVSDEDLPKNAVYDSLNDLPAGCVLSAPISVLRSDAVPVPDVVPPEVEAPPVEEVPPDVVPVPATDGLALRIRRRAGRHRR